MSSNDVQSHMMLMLTESFTKLSIVLGEKTQDHKTEVKSEWPKFAGDVKKFKSWYLLIVVQISIPPWQEFYDSNTNSIVKTTHNTALNSKLYAKLLVSLEGQALQDVVSRSHLRANGILLLHELVQTYCPCKVPEVLAAKAGEFWSKLKRGQNESINSYYNRFQELGEDLNEADDKIRPQVPCGNSSSLLDQNLHLFRTCIILIIFLSLGKLLAGPSTITMSQLL